MISGCSCGEPRPDTFHPATILYDEENFGGEVDAVSTKFEPIVGAGNVISVEYRNQSEYPVEVLLYKFGLLGLKNIVLRFDVAGNAVNADDFTDAAADAGRYYIRIQTAYGGEINGHLQAIQMTEKSNH